MSELIELLRVRLSEMTVLVDNEEEKLAEAKRKRDSFYAKWKALDAKWKALDAKWKALDAVVIALSFSDD